MSKSILVYALHSLEKRPRPCSISDVCAKIIIIIIYNVFKFWFIEKYHYMLLFKLLFVNYNYFFYKLQGGIQKYVSNCALSSGAICLKIFYGIWI